MIPSIKAENLVLYLPLNEGSGTTANDVSGEGNDGSISGTVSSTTWGKVTDGGYALNFDGSSNYVSTGLSVNGFTKATYICWVKIDSIKEYAGLVYSRTDSGHNNGISMGSDAGDGTQNVGMYIYTSSNLGIYASVTLPTNEWHFIAGVYDGSNILIYYDGILSNSDAISGTISSSDAIKLGYDDYSTSRLLDGQIRLPMVFNTALTAEEIKKLYRETYIE